LVVLLAAALYVWRRQNAALSDVTGPIATDTGYLPGPLLSTPLVAEGGSLPAGTAPAPGVTPKPTGTIHPPPKPTPAPVTKPPAFIGPPVTGHTTTTQHTKAAA